MKTENVSTFKIHKLTQAQYDRELAAGNLDENAIYLTPDEETDLSAYATKEEVNSKADSDHTHDTLYDTLGSSDTALSSAKSYADSRLAPVTTSGTGAAYTATVTGITALTAGVSFIMKPHVASTNVQPSLNVNGLGAKTIRRRVTNATTSTATGYAAAWISANKPIEVIYDGTYWIANLPKPSAADMSGTLAISNGGTGATTASAALANLYGIPKTQNVTDSGEDLDNYTTTGVYFFASSYTPTNIPNGSNGWLVVLNQNQADSSSVYVKQIWLRAGTPNSNDYQMYVRTKYTSGGDWGNWYKILTNVLTSNEYGTALPTAGTKGRIFLKKVSS